MAFLDPGNLAFERAPSGYLRLSLADGTRHNKVECIPLFPFSKPDQFVSVAVRKDGKLEEIGIVERLNDLSAQQRVLVKKDMQFQMFTPQITDVKKIDDTFGLNQWDVATDRGERTFYVRDVKENVVIHEDGMVIITDIEKCRYCIADYRSLSPRARSRVESTLM